MKAETLRNEIARAFAGRPHPGEDLVLERRPWSDPALDRVGRALRGKRWQDVGVDVLATLGETPLEPMLYLTAEGFAYYLPAYLTAALEPGVPAHNVADSLVFYLTPPGEWADRHVVDKSEAIVHALSADERDAVVHVFELLEEQWDRMGYPTNSPRFALERRWRALSGPFR